MVFNDIIDLINFLSDRKLSTRGISRNVLIEIDYNLDILKQYKRLKNNEILYALKTDFLSATIAVSPSESFSNWINLRIEDKKSKESEYLTDRILRSALSLGALAQYDLGKQSLGRRVNFLKNSLLELREKLKSETL